ncbi:alcohol oxidase [Apiospora arundinis]
MSDFFCLPRELRDQIYEHCLVSHAHALYPWQPLWSRRVWDFKPTTGLLRVSQTVSLEAAGILYGRNLLDFESAYPYQITSFFRQIGGRNASHIRHLVVDFPAFDPPLVPTLLDRVDVFAYHVDKLALIRRNCPNLQTLTASRAEAYSRLEKNLHTSMPVPDREEVITKALELIDAHFRTVPSLKKIALQADRKLGVRPRSPREIPSEESAKDPFSDHTRKEMERLGWTISSDNNSSGVQTYKRAIVYPSFWQSHIAPGNEFTQFHMSSVSDHMGGRRSFVPTGHAFGGGTFINMAVYSRAVRSDAPSHEIIGDDDGHRRR